MRYLPSTLRRRMSMFMLATCLGTAAACGSNPSPQPPSHAIPRLWVLQAKWLYYLEQTGNGVADRVLRSHSTVLLGNTPLTFPGPGPIPPTAWYWEDLRRFKSVLGDPDQGPFLDHLHLVMYDPEAWSATPVDQQRHPVAYMQRFAASARRHGWKVLLTPTPNLMTVAGGDCVAGAGESPTAAYVRCDIAGSAAKVADIVETQAQGFEGNPDAYSAFVRQTASQARLSNPRVQVIAGLTTSHSAADMYAAWNAVRDVVDGYYLSIGANSQLPVALRFLRMLDSSQRSGP